MELPISEDELCAIIISLEEIGDIELSKKLTLVKTLRDAGLPYLKILREQYGMVA